MVVILVTARIESGREDVTMRRITYITLIFSFFFLASMGVVSLAQSPKDGDTRSLPPPVLKDDGEAQENLPPLIPVDDRISQAFVIPLKGMIDDGLFASIKRRTETAREAGADFIVFEIDTWGGLLGSAFEISDHIASIDYAKTVAFIPKKAVSAGSLIAVACNEIVMAPGSIIGDCAPIMMIPSEGYKILGEKTQSPIRAYFRKFAEENGYPILLAEAMVTKELRVYRDENGEWLTGEEHDRLTEEESRRTDLIVREGQLLTLTNSQALQYGFANYVAKDRKELLNCYGIAGVELGTLDTNWSEEMVRFLNLISPVLVVIGLVALWLEFKAPGFGVAGITAIVCFAVVFFAKYTVGLAETPEILIVVAGVALLAVELFVIPGFGIIGVLGIAFIIGGMLMIFTETLIPEMPYQSADLANSFASIIASLAAAIAICVGLARIMPHTPFLRRLVLFATENVDMGYVASKADDASLVGQRGKALSTLRPAGRCEFGERVVSVVTEGDFVAKGQTVKVTEVCGNRVVVRPV